MKLNCSVLPSEEMSARLAKLEKSSEAARVEVLSSKQQVALADTGEAELEKVVPEVFQESERPIVRFIIAPAGRSRAVRLMHSFGNRFNECHRCCCSAVGERCFILSPTVTAISIFHSARALLGGLNWCFRGGGDQYL